MRKNSTSSASDGLAEPSKSFPLRRVIEAILARVSERGATTMGPLYSPSLKRTSRARAQKILPITSRKTATRKGYICITRRFTVMWTSTTTDRNFYVRRDTLLSTDNESPKFVRMDGLLLPWLAPSPPTSR